MPQSPVVSLDILIEKNGRILLGLLSPKWGKGKKLYGVPGREIRFGETISDSVKRNIKEELGCKLKHFEIIGVGENFALKNHYLGIVVLAEIEGEPKVVCGEDWVKWEWIEEGKIPKNLFAPAKKALKIYHERYSKSLTLDQLQGTIAAQAKEKGFGSKPSDINVGEKIALIHSEVSEAYEAYRKKKIDGKHGFKQELADVAYRLVHLYGVFGFDFEKEMAKLLKSISKRQWDWTKYNETVKRK